MTKEENVDTACILQFVMYGEMPSFQNWKWNVKAAGS